MKGLACSNLPILQETHNELSDEQEESSSSHDQYFVSYVPFKGRVYELDSSAPGPVVLGAFHSDQDWVTLAEKEVLRKIKVFQLND